MNDLYAVIYNLLCNLVIPEQEEQSLRIKKWHGVSYELANRSNVLD
jgi:hypothetical protein